MKKISILLLLTAMVITVSAQEMRIGLLGGINSTWLFNKNISDAGNRVDYASTFGGSLGVNGVYQFSENSGISIGFLYAGHNQAYEGDVEGGPSTENRLMLRYLDIPILLRLTSASGPYFEIGPQISLLMGATEDFTLTPGNKDDNYSGKDFKDNFNGSNIAIALGFGIDIEASETVVVTTGLRFGYGLTDVTKEFTENEIIALDVTDKLSEVLNNSHTTQNNSFKYEKTSRAFGGLMIGIAYRLQ